MKVFELERLLAVVKDKQADVMIGLNTKSGEYFDAEITTMDNKGAVGILYIEAEEA